MKKIFQLILEGRITGIQVNGIPINNLRYAICDTAILTENTQELQTILDTVNELEVLVLCVCVFRRVMSKNKE